MIGHGLLHARHAPSRAAWDRAIAIGFAIGSSLFFIGPFPGVVGLIGVAADSALFFAGSVFFTLAAGLELREATLRLGRWSRDASWWSAAIQFVGTLFFNLSTFEAMKDGFSAGQERHLVWAPDAYGSTAFLASGLLAYRVANRARRASGRRDRDWTIAAVGLAGCVLFAISAIASFVVPSSGSQLDLAAANWTTALGALCFLWAALLLLPARRLTPSTPGSPPTSLQEA